MNQLLFYMIIGVVALIILKEPYVGATITVVSAPIIALIPPLPYFASAMPLVGAITVASFIWQKRGSEQGAQLKFTSLHLVGLLFILWIFFSNPQAAWSGQDRNWVFTYVQLWVLMYVAGELFNEPRKHQLLMGVFALVSVVSAYVAITQGYIAEDILESARATGFATNANEAARYFVVAMVFLTYLRSRAKPPFLRLLLLGSIFITYLGVFYTASRSGMVLLFFAQMLLFLFHQEGRQRIQYLVIFGLAFALIVTLAEPILDILRGILPAITRGTDTIGLRYDLWRGGWAIFLDKPIAGVGIGMYRWSVWRYMAQIPGLTPRGGIVAHSTYVSILAETGIIGFGLFMLMLFIAVKNLFKSGKEADPEINELRVTWLIVLLVMVIGGVTKTEHVDKLLFMMMGLSVYFASLASTPVNEALSKEEKLRHFRNRKFVSRF